MKTTSPSTFHFATSAAPSFTDTIFSVYSHTRIDSVWTAGGWRKYTPKGDSTYVYLPNTYIGNLEGFIKPIKNGIKPYGAFRLKVIDRRWYMIFRGIEY